MRKEVIVKVEGRLYQETLMDALASFPFNAEIQTLSSENIDNNQNILTILGVWS